MDFEFWIWDLKPNQIITIAPWCSGSIRDSGSLGTGSNPVGAVIGGYIKGGEESPPCTPWVWLAFAKQSPRATTKLVARALFISNGGTLEASHKTGKKEGSKGIPPL